jgi:hypothetical protein
MKQPLVLLIILVILAAVGVGFGQEAGDDSPAVQAVLRLSNAIGLELGEGATVYDYLAELERLGIISPTTRVALEESVITGELTAEVFTIFLADVLNGTAPAPESVEAAASVLASVGVLVPESPLVDVSQIAVIVSSPDFATAVGEEFRQPVSPINSIGG